MSQFQILGLTFYPYGLILGLAILAGLQASLWLAKRRKIPVQLIEGLFWWVFIGGVIGARAYHVIDKWREIYSLNPQSVFYVWNGGLGIWGALTGGILAAGIWYIAVHRKRVIPANPSSSRPPASAMLEALRAGKRGSIDIDSHFRGNDNTIRSGMTGGVSFLQLLDVVMFGVPLGQAIGRWGNFFNNEIVGKNGEPLFLYESVLSLVLFGGLVGLVRSGGFGKSGKISGLYLVGYGVIRFLLEPLRPETMVWKIGGMPTASIVSAVAILTGIYLISWRRRS